MTALSVSSKKGRKPVPSHRQIICRSIGMMAADWARAEALAERLDMSVTELARQAILSYIGSKTEDAGRLSIKKWRKNEHGHFDGCPQIHDRR